MNERGPEKQDPGRQGLMGQWSRAAVATRSVLCGVVRSGRERSVTDLEC